MKGDSNRKKFDKSVVIDVMKKNVTSLLEIAFFMISEQ